MLVNVMNTTVDEDGELDLPETIAGEDGSGRARAKIKTIGRLNRMFTTLREEQEVLLKIKNMSPDGKIPRGLLLKGKPAIKNCKCLRNL